MEINELKTVVTQAVKDAHVCKKEEEIAHIKATCEQIKVFGNGVKEIDGKIDKIAERITISDERTKNITEMLSRNERDHSKFDDRLVNIAKIVENDHAPVIASVRGVGNTLRYVGLAILTTALIGLGAFILNLYITHSGVVQP